jgi:diguanylate cyclase (GGDEF)-like protein
MSSDRSPFSQTPHEDRRQAERYPTRIIAHIMIAGHGTVACVIRDYCGGGLYMRVMEPAAIAVLRRLEKSEPVVVQFPSETGTVPAFACQALIAHVEADGLGVAFTDPPSREGFEYLRQSTRPTREKPAEAGVAGETAESLLSSCTKVFQEHLPLLMTHYQNTYEATLQETADKSSDFRIKREIFDAVALLKQSFDRLRREFLRLVAANSTSLLEKGVDQYSDAPVEGELRLVDQGQFEDWLNITNEITRTEDRFESLLRDFNQRYSVLTGNPPDNRTSPFSPAVIGHAFRQAANVLDLGNVARRELYGVLGHSMRSQLAPLYRDLNDRLRQIALPKPEAAKIRHTHVPEAERRGTEPSAAETQSLSRLLRLIQENLSSASASPGGAGQMPEGAGGGVAPGGAPMAGFAGAGAMPGRAGAATEGAGSGVASGAWPQPGGGAGAVPGPAPYAASGTPGPAGMPPAARAAAATLLQYSPMEMLAMHGVPVGDLSHAQRQVIEAAGNLVRTTLSLAQFPTGVQPYVDRLQVPLLKLSLADPTVLDTEAHPARRLLDGIDMLSLAANEKGELAEAGLRKKLDELVERVVEQADQGPTVFHVAQTAMDRLVEPYTRVRLGRITRVQQAAEGKQRVEDAIDAANRELKTRLAGQRVPRLLVDLVAKGWRHHLILTALRHGEASEEWSRAVAVLDEVLVYLGYEATDPRQEAERRLLLQRIEDGLAQVNTDSEDQTRFNDTLMSHLLGNVEEVPPCPMVKVADAYLAEKSPEAPLSPTMLTRLRNLRVGEWLRFNEENGAPVSLQLVWVGKDAKRFVFVNRQGVKKLELDRQGMAERLAKAEAERTDNLDTPLSTRSEDAMVQQVQDVLVERVSHDPATGLINRREFLRQICQKMPAIQEEGNTAVMGMLEIDQLRAINDTCGLDAGDQLLQELGKRLAESLDGGNMLARAGDSSFAFCLMDCSKEQGLKTAEALRASFEKYHFRWENMSYTVGASIGLTFCDKRETSAESALRKADAACLRATEQGRNVIEFYEETDVDLQNQHRLMEWAGRIDQVMQQNRLFIRCQRILPLDPFSRMEQHFEILLGVKDEQGEIIPAEEFFAAVEHWRRAIDIDRWLLANLFPWLRENKDKFNWSGGFSVNLSGQTLNNQATLDYLLQELNRADLPRERLVFEITETAAIENIGLAENFIRRVKRYGCQFALDEFGTGYCSYSYLKNLRVDFIKISGAFVQGIDSNPADYAMVRSMNEIARSLSIKTIAKNVTSQGIMNALRDIGVDYAQGYKVGNPILLSDLA